MRTNVTSLIVILAIMWFGALSKAMLAQESSADNADKSTQTDLHVESFTQVWKSIKDAHWDREKVGEKWDAKYNELLPKVKSAKDINEVRGLMEELIGSLEQSHFGIIPSDAYSAIEDDENGEGKPGFTGIVGRLGGEKLIVAKVFEGSPAEKAGVKSGWLIQKVGETTAEKILERSKKAATGPMRVDTVVGMYCDRVFKGKEGRELNCIFLNGKEEKTITITAIEERGNSSKFGNLPEMKIDFESKKLDSNIGYFRFNMFFDPVRIMPAFRKAVEDSREADGFIIDLRGNYGGIGAMTMGMASPFAKDTSPLGVMKMRGNEMKFAVNVTAKPYDKPVVVLIDECSISSSEILAGGLKDLNVARVIGRSTAGLALPSQITKLPNGDGFQFAFADYHSASGKTLEGEGVKPHEEIVLSPQTLNGDPFMMAAEKWIKSQK